MDASYLHFRLGLLLARAVQTLLLQSLHFGYLQTVALSGRWSHLKRHSLLACACGSRQTSQEHRSAAGAADFQLLFRSDFSHEPHEKQSGGKTVCDPKKAFTHTIYTFTHVNWYHIHIHTPYDTYGLYHIHIQESHTTHNNASMHTHKHICM
jgi:hypothetical protein